MEERLQKILARAGVASRRHAEELIVQGRVTVNGEPVRELGSRADPARDRIAIDGRPLPPAVHHVYIMLNKPPGYVVTRADPAGRPTVYDLVPPIPGLFSVGRLDQDTEGLLLLTTDGEWAQRLAHPRYNVEREYEAQVRGPITEEALERLRAGVFLGGRLARPVAVRQVARPGFAHILAIVMTEGRKREVRQLCAAAGLPVKRLVRRRFGSLLLGWLEPGHWRYLDRREADALAGWGRRSQPHGRGRREDDGSRDGAGESWAGADAPVASHRSRRTGGFGEVHDRPHAGADAGLPLSRHGRDVPRHHRPGARSRD